MTASVLRVYATVTALLLLLGGVAALTVRFDIAPQELAGKYAGAPSRFVAVDGMEVHYRDRGTGEPLLLVHGSNASLHTWEGWAERLAPHLRVVMLDLPGHSLTGPHPENAYDPVSMAHFLDRFVTRLGIERLSLAGNSMGGEIAWHYALLYPDKVSKLILLDATGYPREEPLPPIFKAYATPLIGRLLTVLTPRFAIAASLRDIYGDPARVSEAQVTRYHELALRAGNREATRIRLSAVQSHGYVPRLRELTAPTLIMWGAEDRWVLPKYGARFAEDIPGSVLRVYPGLGHIPMEEDPATTAADALRFLLPTGLQSQR